MLELYYQAISLAYISSESLEKVTVNQGSLGKMGYFRAFVLPRIICTRKKSCPLYDYEQQQHSLASL